jgi:AraC-like DNA-binding protein
MKKTGVVTKLVLPLVRKYMNWQLTKHPHGEDSISMMIAGSLPGVMGVNGSSVNDIAKVLNIHPKKIQRLLKDEGTNYSDVLDDVRKNIAERLLIESDISIVRLAKMLDYSSDRPFTAAAKRWFDLTPTEFRRAQRAKKSKGVMRR